jgi:hypothetical protein
VAVEAPHPTLQHRLSVKRQQIQVEGRKTKYAETIQCKRGRKDRGGGRREEGGGRKEEGERIRWKEKGKRKDKGGRRKERERIKAEGGRKEKGQM